MSCALPTLKFTLLVLNTICCIFGFFIILSCVYSLKEYNESEVIKIPCILEIALSSILFLNGIFGCWSISSKLMRFIWMYAFIMLLLLMSQIAVIFFAPINFTDIDIELINKMWKSDMQSQFMMSMYEIKYKCCGKFGPNDYIELGLSIPLSCYMNFNATVDNRHTRGCLSSLLLKHSINQKTEQISDWTLVALEGTSAFVAVILAITLKNVYRRSLYH